MVGSIFKNILNIVMTFSFCSSFIKHVYFLVNISEYMSLWAQEIDLQER